jgi:hypothetical protein
MNDQFIQLYNYLKSNGMTDLDAQSFYNEYRNDDSNFNELYGYLKSNGMTDLDANSFKNSYFNTPSEPKEQKWRSVTKGENAGRLNYRKGDFRTWDIVEETQKGMTKQERKQTGFDYTPEEISAGKEAVADLEAPTIEYSDLKIRRGKDNKFYKIDRGQWYEVDTYGLEESRNTRNGSIISLEGADLKKLSDNKKIQELNKEFGESAIEEPKNLFDSGIDIKMPSVIKTGDIKESDDVFGGWDKKTESTIFRKNDRENIWEQHKMGVDSEFMKVTEAMAKELNKRYGGNYGHIPTEEPKSNYDDYGKRVSKSTAGSGVLKTENYTGGEFKQESELLKGLPPLLRSIAEPIYLPSKIEQRNRGFKDFEQRVESFITNTNIAKMDEADAVPLLTKEFGRFGFEFIEGTGDQMIVRTKDGLKEIAIDLDNFYDENNISSNLALRDFLSTNQDPSSYEGGNQGFAELINADRKLIYSNNSGDNPTLYKDLQMLFNDEDYKIRLENLPYAELVQEVEFRNNEYRRLMNKPGVNSEQVFKDMKTFQQSPIYKKYEEKRKESIEFDRQKIQSLYDDVKLDPGSNSRARQKSRMFFSEKYLDKARTEYNARFKDINSESKLLYDDYQEYNDKVKELSNSKLSPDQKRTKQQELDKIKLNLDIDMSNLIRRKKAVANDVKNIEYLSGKYFVDVAKEGSFIGAVMNSFSSGISKVINAADIVGRNKAETKGSQTADYMTPEEKRYYNTKGYSVDEIKIAAANKAYKESKELLTSKIKSTIGDMATTKEYQQSEDRGIVSKALFGLAESIPAMATAAIPYIGGAVSFTALSAQAYSSLEDEMLNDPDFETTSLTDMNLIAVPYAIGMGVLEKIGLSAAMSKNPLAKSLIMKSIQGTILKTAGKGSAELFQNVMDKEIKSNMAKFGLRIVGGALTEAETGATQSLVLDIGYKKLINEIKKDDILSTELTGGELFDTPDSFMDGLAMVIEDGIAEGIGGMVMSGAGAVSQKVINGNISLYDNEDVDFLKTVSTDNELRKMIVIDLKAKMLSGKITKSEAQNQLESLDKVSAIFKAMPDNLSIEDQVKSVNLISEKQRLEKVTKDGKDQSLVAAQKERITEIDNELKNISKDAFQKQTTGEATVGEEVVQEINTREEIEKRRKETEDKIKNKSLFLAEFDENGDKTDDSVGEKISQSDVAPVPTLVREINGIEFVEFSNPETGDVDVIVTGKNDGSYVGYYRLYDKSTVNGKVVYTPTNRWSSKFENKGPKADFKTMISGAQEMLPQDHEYTEKESISTDGLRVWEQQLSKGYEIQRDENGKIVTENVAINGDAIVNELGIPEERLERGKFRNINVTSQAEFDKVKKALLPYLEKLGLNESNIRWMSGPLKKSGTVRIDLPVLIKSKSQTQEEVGTNVVVAKPKEITIDKPIITTNTTSEVDRVKSVDIEAEDGATFNIDGTKYEGGGLVVPIVSENTTVEEITPEMISDFVEKHSSKIGDQNTVKVGIYKFPNSNKVSIDLNIVAPESSRQQAIEFAKSADQESLFDLSTFENVKTGGTGANPTQFTDEQFKEIARSLNEGRAPSFTVLTETAPVVKQDITQNQVTLDNVDEVSNKQMATATKLVLNALPGVKIYIHKTNEEYSAAIGAEAEAGDRGAYDTEEGAIHINLSAGGNAQTVFHEAIHHALLKKGMDSGAILDLANGLNRIITDKKLKKRLSDFVSQYETSDQSEEYVSELGAIMAEAEIELTTTKFNQFKALIAKIFQKLGLPKSMIPFLNAMNSENAVEFINGLTRSLRTGEEITDISNTQEIKNPIEKIKKSKKIGSSKTKIEIVYVEQDRMQELIDKGLLEQVKDISIFNEKYVATTSPDDMLVGNIFINGDLKAEGNGGVFFVTKFGDVWASSNKRVADQITKRINKSLEINGGKGYLVLVKGTDAKLISSPQGASSSLKIVEALASDGLISASDFKKSIISALQNNKDTKAKINFSGKSSPADMISAVDSLFDDVSKSSFDNRGTLLKSIVVELGKTESIKNNNKKIIEFLGGDTSKNIGWSETSKNTNTSQSAIDLIAGVSREELTKGLNGGDIYAIIEVNDEVIVSKDSHQSYPFHIKQKNGKAPKLILLENRQNGRDVMVSSSNESIDELGKSFDGKVLGRASNGYGDGYINTEKSSKGKQFKKQKTDKLTEPVAGNKLFNEPLKDAERIAQSYMQSIGMEYVPVEKITKLDEDLSKRISDAYDQMENNPNDPEVKAAYEAMAKETLDQYDAILKEGYNVEINNNEPYSNSEAMIKDLKDNKRMNIFSTESGFGDEPITDEQRSENLLLKDSGRKDVNGETLLINDVFRFVHDFFGHAKLGNSFGPIGEENAWRVHSEMYSPEAKKAMTSETRGQNSFVNFSGVNDAVFKKRDKARELRKEGKIEEADRLVGEVYEEMKFADQKVGLLPSFAVEEGTPSKIKKQLTSNDYNVISKKVLDDKELNTVRASLRASSPDSFSLEILDAIAKKESIDTGNDDLNQHIDYAIENGLSIGTIANLILEDDVITEGKGIDSKRKAIDYALNIGGKGTILKSAQQAIEEGAPSKIKKQKTTTKTEAIQNAKDIYEKSFKRFKDDKRAIANAVNNLEKSKWYRDADDMQREDAVREIKAFFGEKIKKAPSVAKILGKPKPETQTKTVDSLRKEFFTAWNKASREAKADLNSKRKAIGAIIKSMVRSGKITIKQSASITDRASNVSFDYPPSVQRFLDYVAKVFADANYQEKLSNAFSMKKAIKRLTKSNNQAEVIGMAKMFLNIDPSMVEDIDTYNEIADSIKNAMAPSVTIGEKVKFKQPANIADVNEYTMDELSRQEEIRKDQLLAEYDYLKEAGLISKDMTLNEIKSIIEEMKSPEAETENNKVNEFVTRRLDMMLGVVESIIRTGVNPITGEAMEISDKNKDILKAIMKMDLKELDTRSLIYLSESVDNFLNNGITSGLEANVQSYIGAMNVKALVNAGVKSVSIRTVISRSASKEILSIPLFFEKIFRGTIMGNKVMKEMGLLDLVRGKNTAEMIYNMIMEEYTKQDFYGKDFMTHQNIIERGMLGYLMRNVNGDPLQVKSELNRRIESISQSIDRLKEEGNKDEQKLAEMYEIAYSKLNLKSKDIDLIRANSSKQNRQAVDWWIDQWKQHYTDLYDVSLSVYNTMLSSDINYTPDKQKLISSRQTADQDISKTDSSFGSNLQYTDTKKSGVLMENSRTLAKNRYIDLNFDSNNANSLRNALVDIKTAGTIRQLKGFIDSENFYKLAGDQAAVIKDRVNTYVKRMKGKGVMSKDNYQEVMKYFNALSKAGTIRALGGIGSAIKQFSPIINTLINSGRFTSLTPSSSAWINRLGMPISNRGIQAEANIDSINKKTNALSESPLGKVYDGVSQVGDMWLKALIQYPDVYVARSSFITYYLKSLRDQGLSEKIDWDNHVENKKASEYAQIMVDRQQNISDPLLAGDLFMSENNVKNMVTKIIMPFTSFVWNQRARMINDIQISFSKHASNEDKKIARLSLIALPAEIIVFNVLGAAIRKTIDAITNYLYGEDDDEEEVLFYVFGMKITEDDIKEVKTPIRNMLVDLFSPLPGMTDEPLVAGLNKLFEQFPLIGDDEISELVKVENDIRIANGEKPMDDKQKEKFIEQEKEKRKFQLYENMEPTGLERYIPGAPGVALKTYTELYDAMSLALTGKYETENDFGKKTIKYISDEDRKKIGYGLYFQIAQVLNLLPREAGTITSKGIRNIKRRASTENKKTKTEELEKMINRPVGKIEKVLIDKNVSSKNIFIEMKYIDKAGGFTESQQNEYAKLRKIISKTNYYYIKSIQSGMTSEDIIKRIVEARKK